MKNVICSSCGARVQIASHAAAFVGLETICPSCLNQRQEAPAKVKKADQPLPQSRRWSWLKRPWRRSKST